MTFSLSWPKNIFLIAALVLVLLATFNGFYKLDAIPAQDFDEARHAISAIEMIQSGNFLINTHNGTPDYLNAKPPMSFWFSASGYSISPTLWGLRAPSVLISLATIFMTATWSWLRISPSVGVSTGFILATIPSFFLNHNARTADPDALYVFFAQCAVLATLETYYNRKKIGRYLYTAALFVALAFLTKSWHAASIATGILGIAITTIGFRNMLQHVTGMFILGSIPTGLWAYLRYSADGFSFFNTMIFYDVVQRSTQQIEGHPTAILFYADRILGTFPHWLGLVAILAGLAMYTIRKAGDAGQRTVPAPYRGLAIFSAVIFAIFTASTSKLSWYIYSIYPAISMLLAWSICALSEITIRVQRLRYAPIILFSICVAIQETRLVTRVHHMANQRPTAHQQIIDLAQDYSTHGKPVRFACTSWTPSMFLLVKLYGGFSPAQDNAEAEVGTITIDNCQSAGQ